MTKMVRECEEMMRVLAEAGFTLSISKAELEKFIMVRRGGDPRTVKNWLRNLRVLGYVEPASPFVFKLNFERCGEALGLIVKSGQKKLL